MSSGIVDRAAASLDRVLRDGRVGHEARRPYPGLATDRRLDVEAASRLVGMKFKLDEHRASAEITPQTYDDPALREVKSKLALGSGAVVGPRLLYMLVWKDTVFDIA